ncbi:MAG: ATP-binding protein [Bacteroidales bacterium]|nr:ATP-binding protein [Bacteroidales bacterium]MCQ2284214.1 ATP-binding protein [Bacteroidales bacterium]
MFIRHHYQQLQKRMEEPRHFIEVVVGPRQVGKTTLVKQVLNSTKMGYHHVAADNVPTNQTNWISEVWNTARSKMRASGANEYLLVIDEIQKIPNWSEVVKKEWDDDTFNDVNIKVILLGSSRVLLEKGLADSLAGRFEEIRMSHWSWPEMRDSFGMTLEEYIYYGGYPGAAPLISDTDRWSQYIESAIVDATINKDILQNHVVTKPALLRQTFELGSSFSSQELSVTKIMGQMQDAGNTTTISSYLQLLSDAGLLTGLQKFANDKARKRASTPKFQVHNSALKNYLSPLSLENALIQPKQWGRFYESAIGAHLVSKAFENRFDLFYWRQGNDEVDYVIQKRDCLMAIEVKSNHEKTTTGLQVFKEKFSPKVSLIIGPEGIGVEEFLSHDPIDYL